MADKLQLYNEALSHCKETRLATLAEARPSRRALDLHYDSTLKYMIEQGYWKFATRSVSITFDPSIVPPDDFGYRHAFNTPTDWVKTYQVSASGYFDPPLEKWIRESNLFWGDEELVYLRYISNSDTDYGYDLTAWPGEYQLAFTLELACRILPLLPGSDAKLDKLEERARRKLLEALASSAATEPPRRPPMGSWNSARFFSGRPRGENRG